MLIVCAYPVYCVTSYAPVGGFPGTQCYTRIYKCKSVYESSWWHGCQIPNLQFCCWCDWMSILQKYLCNFTFAVPLVWKHHFCTRQMKQLHVPHSGKIWQGFQFGDFAELNSSNIKLCKSSQLATQLYAIMNFKKHTSILPRECNIGDSSLSPIAVTSLLLGWETESSNLK